MKTITITNDAYDILKRVKGELKDEKETGTLSEAVIELDRRTQEK